MSSHSRNLIHFLLLGLIFITPPTPCSSLNIAHSGIKSTISPVTTSTVSVTEATTILDLSTNPQESELTTTEATTSATPPKQSKIIRILPPPPAVESRGPKKIKLANTPFLRLNRMNTGSRTNSRFLQRFPPVEYLEFARRDVGLGNGNGMGMGSYNNHHNQQNTYPNYLDSHIGHHRGGGSDEDGSDFSQQQHQSYDDDPNLNNQIGNSPVFYIKLPPAPYVYVNGLGYVSPHPYQNENDNLLGTPSAAGFGLGGFGGSPMMMSPLGSFDFPPDQLSSQSSSNNANVNNNVISLPLKFISNARPAIIIDPKPGKDKNGIHGGKENTNPTLLSGGHYSFNGRPNGVFIVRSPASRLVNQHSNTQQRYHIPVRSSAGAGGSSYNML